MDKRKLVELVNVLPPAPEPKPRKRWPLRGGRRCRYNGGPFVTDPKPPRPAPYVQRAFDKSFARFLQELGFRDG